LVDSDAFTQYLASIYWTFETLTTVGYGDITPGTSSERVLTVIWMLVGVAFYSFTIGNLSSILADMDRRSQILKNKLTAFNNFASRVKLSDMIRLKIQNFFE
jgi:voltage-gated potassium channel Kch